MHRAHLVALALAGLTVGCGRELPAPAAPPRELPAALVAPSTPPEPGKQRVLVDTPGDKAELSYLTGTTTNTNADGVAETSNVYTTVCRETPCSVDLPLGHRQLVFQSRVDPGKRGPLDLDLPGGSPIAVRHVLGTTRWNGAATVGVVALVAGAVAMGAGIGYVSAASKDTSSTPGIVMIPTGGVVMLTGLFMTIFSRDRTPGATTTWTTAARPPALVTF